MLLGAMCEMRELWWLRIVDVFTLLQVCVGDGGI